MTHKAIPTKYAGHTFRSRLEARWAAFFDVCKWDWEYEPVDLNGWIPDFRLTSRAPQGNDFHGTSVFVEVKPITKFCQATVNKIQHASKESKNSGEVLLLGEGLLEGYESYRYGVNESVAYLGWLGERWGELGDNRQPLSQGPFGEKGGDGWAWYYTPLACNSVPNNDRPYDFRSLNNDYSCRLSGFYDGGHTHDTLYGDAKKLWGKASSAVQYKGSEASE